MIIRSQLVTLFKLITINKQKRRPAEKSDYKDDDDAS